MNTIKLIILSMRPKQWIKNLFIFAPLIFSLHFSNLAEFKQVLLSFLLFSIITGNFIGELMDACLSLLSNKRKG